MKYPCLFLAGAAATGILAASAAAVTPFQFLVVLLGFLAAGWAAFAAGKIRTAFVFVLMATAAFGGAVYAHEDARYAANPLRTFQAEGYVDFTGILVKSPSRDTDRDILLLRVDGVRTQGNDIPMEGRLRVTVPVTPGGGGRIRLHARDRIRVSAQLSKGGDYHNFHPPFYARFLKNRKIHARAFAKSARLVEKIAGGPRFSPAHRMSRLRLAAQDKIESRFSSPPPASLTPTGAVLEALMLGENGRLDAQTLRRLQASGLYHLFAISGAHIAILSLMIYAFLRLIRLRRRISHLILMSALIAYALFVEGRPSVFRATLMALVYLAGRLLWRDAPPLNSAAFSGLVLLIANPFSLFDIGFQLTFAATLSIILFAPRLMHLLPRLPLRAGEMTAVSTAALAGVLPLVARHFNRVTFSSIPLNLAAVPLVAAIMLAGFLFIPLSFIAPFAAGLAASLLEILIPLFLKLSGTLGGAAPFSYRVPTPGWPVLVGYGAGLGLLLVPFRKRWVRATARSALAVVSILLVVHPFPARSRDLRMTLIDVGQGESILVEFPGKSRMLVDGGGLHDDSFDLGENVVSPFLWRRGIRRIDVLVLTHPHPDHLNGLVSVVRNFKIGESWEAFPPEQGAVYARLEKALANTRRRRVFQGAGATAVGARIEVLHPDEQDRGTSLSENDLSLVLKIVYGETAFLLTGDIGRAAEDKLAGGTADLSATVLKSPHHGSRTSSSAAFIEKVRPAVAVISVGRDNNFGLPNREVLETYETAKIRVYRTDFHGAVEIISDGREIRIRTSRTGIPAL